MIQETTDYRRGRFSFWWIEAREAKKKKNNQEKTLRHKRSSQMLVFILVDFEAFSSKGPQNTYFSSNP